MKRLFVTVAAIALVLSAAAPAHAESTVHEDVAYALERVPGGMVINATTAEWPELGMRLEVTPTRAVGSCATGSICVYSGDSLTGTKLSWTTCGSKSTAALSSVASIANARTSGTLTARQGTTVRATAAAGGQATVPLANRASITSVNC